MHFFSRLSGMIFFVAASLLLPVQAQAVEGTFALVDGTYSINVEMDGDSLVVVEPNKRSVYTPQGEGTYVFHNVNTGSKFYLKVLDENTLEAGRVPSSGNPSILKRLGGAATAAVQELNEEFTAIAEGYAAKAQSDPVNAQAWTMCAAAAYKRAMSGDAEFADYARQAAQTLQLLDASSNPCPDAIPQQYW